MPPIPLAYEGIFSNFTLLRRDSVSLCGRISVPLGKFAIFAPLLSPMNVFPEGNFIYSLPSSSNEASPPLWKEVPDAFWGISGILSDAFLI